MNHDWFPCGWCGWMTWDCTCVQRATPSEPRGLRRSVTAPKSWRKARKPKAVQHRALARSRR